MKKKNWYPFLFKQLLILVYFGVKIQQFVNGFMKLSDETNSPYIHNHSKALAFNKFKPILYKHYSRFKKISRLGNHLNQSLVVLYDYNS